MSPILAENKKLGKIYSFPVRVIRAKAAGYSVKDITRDLCHVTVRTNKTVIASYAYSCMKKLESKRFSLLLHA